MHHYRAKQDPSSSHGQITRLVRQLNRGPVLDVGAAQGILGQMLADANLPIDAIEPHAAWADAARPHYRNVFNCTIETANGLPDRYAVVLCGDVLEHTADPVGALRKLRAYAADDATFIVSLPNVAHLSVRLMLLFGRFPRMQRGILDRTHLHFFTRDTAIDMLREAGLRVERVSATPAPLEEVWPRGRHNPIFKLIMAVQKLFVRLLPRAFAYQWVFVARAETSRQPR
jgi:2-polyprenyl-3-methyl-5-hydroxy-6-metoxy-1,4-benzoquinol methylase